MSATLRLLVPALLLSACSDPYMQGMSTATDGTGTSESGTTETGETTGPSTGLATVSGPSTDSTGPTTGTTGQAESCDDGKHNQDESDVDCGGTCAPCVGDAKCGSNADCASGKCNGGTCFPLVRSCLELYQWNADLPSGDYPLDPDGDGADPLIFTCDMNPDDPGWTVVFTDAFEPAPDDAWDPATTGTCGSLGTILGPFGMGDTLHLDLTAQRVPHTQLRITAEVAIIDSWDLFDYDSFQILLDGVEIFSQQCDEPVADTCGQMTDICGDPGFDDAELPISVPPVPHETDAIALAFTSNLNEPIEKEAWGLDKVAVAVK